MRRLMTGEGIVSSWFAFVRASRHPISLSEKGHGKILLYVCSWEGARHLYCRRDSAEENAESKRLH